MQVRVSCTMAYLSVTCLLPVAYLLLSTALILAYYSATNPLP